MESRGPAACTLKASAMSQLVDGSRFVLAGTPSISLNSLLVPTFLMIFIKRVVAQAGLTPVWDLA